MHPPRSNCDSRRPLQIVLQTLRLLAGLLLLMALFRLASALSLLLSKPTLLSSQLLAGLLLLLAVTAGLVTVLRALGRAIRRRRAMVPRPPRPL